MVAAGVRFPLDQLGSLAGLPGEKAVHPFGAGQRLAAGAGLKYLGDKGRQVQLAGRETVGGVVDVLLAVRADENAQVKNRIDGGHRPKGIEGVQEGGRRLFGVVCRDQLALPAGLGDDDRRQRSVQGAQGAVGLKDQRRFEVGVVHGDLGIARDQDDERVAGVAQLLEGEGQLGLRGDGRPGLYVEQLQKLDVGQLGELVELEEQRFGQPGVQLDQRHAGVGVVEVGPLRRVAGDARAGFFDEIFEAAGIEIRGGEWHAY